MRFNTLRDWLAWQETLHPKAIDLGLERCQQVAARLGLRHSPFPVITVAGTNGKGSCVAMLQSILAQAGYRVGAYTSPHLVRYNERIQINGQEVTDDTIICAFNDIDQARGSTSLTYFEFATLTAMQIFQHSGVDVVVLEVGVGGRLDAVNMFDADIALVSTVDLDHMHWLGPDRESIGLEKAGIFRPKRPAVYGELDVPASVKAYAKALNAPLFYLGQDFTYDAGDQFWQWATATLLWSGLPFPGLPGAFQLQNAAAVLMVVKLLGERSKPLQISAEAVRAGLRRTTLSARFQVFPGPVTRILDVAHNAQAARALAGLLEQAPCAGRTRAVLAMMADKDIQGVLNAVHSRIDVWYLADLNTPRGASAAVIAKQLSVMGRAAFPIHLHSNVANAYRSALRDAEAGDRVVVFGSFYAVGDVLHLEQGMQGQHRTDTRSAAKAAPATYDNH